ncbi:ComEA family DNA-binding protein [Nocardioides terrae]|nr:ComEA family DNA-binding protein [Nocardioides terrae]
MRTRPDHREAVARRLELLRAELDPDAVAPPRPPADPWADSDWEAVPVLELLPPVTDDPDPPLVPVPGRHASRRRAAALAGCRERVAALVPETLHGRVGLSAWHLTVLALLVAAGLAVTCWSVMRGDPKVAPVPAGAAAPLVAVTAGSPGTSPSAVTASGPAAATTASTVTVDVTGKVRRPGVLDLPAGSRVVDAIAAAGGARPGADLSGLNRARVLVDGEQVVVGGPAPAGAAGSSAAGSAGAAVTAPEALVNLNTATVDELETLPEVGPVTAQAILDYRTEHGGFGAVDELLDIEGIGEKTLEKIAPRVTV